MPPRITLKTKEFRMVRRFSRVVRIALVGMGLVMTVLAVVLAILGWPVAEMLWMSAFNAALGIPILLLGIRGTPWSHNFPWSRGS